MSRASGRAFLGIGLRFPIGIDSRGGIATAEEEDSIEQSIRIIIGTAPGERVHRPDFGCGIHALVFSPNNDRTRALARHYVEEALARWEPRIRGIRVAAESDEAQRDRLILKVGFEIRSTNHPRNLVFPFYLDTPGPRGKRDAWSAA